MQGSLFAEMFAMVVLAVRLPIVVVVSAPVLMDLLTGPCYLDSKSHSLIMNCGQEIFSLEEFFQAAYACNGHFWRILSKAANFLPPGFAQTFLNGMAAVGENSGASAFMPGIMGSVSKVSENNPMESLDGVQDLVAGGSRFGAMKLFMRSALNPIAGAHWIWRMSSRVIVQCIQASKEQRSIGSVFWNVLYEGRVDYKELVAMRMFNTCGGLALMAGYFTPLGNTILHYCFAGVKSSTATLDLVSVFMVDLPVIVCICKQTGGENPASWIMRHCDAPDGLKPRLRRIMDSPEACSAMMESTNANLTGVFDDTFGELFAGTTSVGSVLDSFVAAVDPEKAGQCDNFETNPYVVTLIPEPADYWRVCGNTDFCRLRCQQQIEAFEKVKPSASVRSTTTTQTVQSLFFPTLNADAYNPFTAGGVVALTELNGCVSLCSDDEDRCFLMAGFVAEGKLSVSQYCVPSALSRGVSKASSWETRGVSGLSTEIQFIKSSVPGAWRDTYCIVGMQDQLIQACARLTCAEFRPSDVGPNVLGFQRMQSLGDVIVLQARVRKGDLASFCLRFDRRWRFTPCDQTNLWDQEMYHVVSSFVKDQVMLLPYDDVPLQVCDVERSSAKLSNCQQYEGFERQKVPVKTRGLQTRVSQSATVEYSIFIASNDPSHWLTMLFVETSGTQAITSVGNSMPVRLTYTLRQGCSLNSCIGCVQLSVQRLCFAAQRCQVARCIGSQVNQIRPLCAVGGTVEATMFAILAGVQGVWTMVSNALSAIIDASGGGINPPKTIKWPDQVFYGLVCSLKDAIASQISILTSMVNGMMQSSMPVLDQAMGETVDNQFLATFTLTMTAVTKFLFQLCLAPLYAAIAAQKVVICQTNSLVAVASGNTVSIGDPEIQTASSAAAGACMTQFSAENAQGTNSGVDNGKAFTSASIDIITQLGGLAMSLPLDALRHPIDVVFTYMLGVVRGLQDILQTTDQRKTSMHSPAAFDPHSCALLAYITERSAVACLYIARRPDRSIPLARRWMKRHAPHALEMLIDDAAEVTLDAVNSITSDMMQPTPSIPLLLCALLLVAPDWTTRVLYKCPCGDQPVSIPPERAAETYLDGAYWCSTVLSLLNFDGTVKYVWNPFSLQQLKTKLGNFDAYLECVATKNNGECSAPSDEIFRKQQIPMLSVYQRCLSNYQDMTWDQGTHVLFNRTLQRTVKLDRLIPQTVPDTFKVASKLLEAKANGFDNTAVLDMFLGGSQAMDYFKYSNITVPNPGSALIDACLTFSGPSKVADPRVSSPFTACLESYANRSGCDIPHMLWSGRSTNKVPVATQHTLTITDPAVRRKIANGEMEATQAHVLAVLDKLEKEWTGDGLKITIFSAEGDLLHQYADCVMQGPLGAMTLTPGPDGVEKVIWSRRSDGTPSRLFELPCSGERLTNRDGATRDNAPPYTCGTYARRAVLKHFLRVTYGGQKENSAAKALVVKEVLALINRTREAWTLKSNFMCTCPDGISSGWDCCEKQKDCATEACPCPSGYNVRASVACCTSVCGGLAGKGIMEPFSKIKGEKLADDMLSDAGRYLRNDIWTSTAPWLRFDPLGAESYEASWKASAFEVSDAGLFDASKPVVHYDEIVHPLKSSFWEHCAGLLQQVIWTMPIDRRTGRPKMPTTAYDPVVGVSQTPNMTYTEEFIQSLTVEAYKASPLYWHYNVRHAPSQSEACLRTAPRPFPVEGASAGEQGQNTARGPTFAVGNRHAALLGFSSMTLGGLEGVDCHCGWWHPPSSTECRIPDALCAAMVQLIGFRRICIDQQQVYVSRSDHRAVLEAIALLKTRQPDLTYPCPALQISEHWGLMDASTGLPFANATDAILTEGASGFRLGNSDWLFDTQATIINPDARINAAETPTTSAAINCNHSSFSASGGASIVDHFIDELFPSAKGVRQSMPQSYCTRYGIELARLAAYRAAGLTSAAGEQKGVADKWKMRCQFKLEELAVCNSFRVMDATGGPKGTAQCPFTLSVITALQESYAVTPGCLLVIWNTAGRAQDGIYDPCICVPCVQTPNIDVPAQLTSICKLESFQTLVAKDVVPTESAQGVPLGSGSFRALMDKPGFLQVNTPDITHWALHTSIRDADLILDWWPEEWRHPAGYHVTPGCSRPKDARWRTFDASWRWDSITEEMRLARDETNDPMLARNAFGASGVCRTSNYGMPITTLNSMVVCTQENANARADPTVPPPRAQNNNNNNADETWADGGEYCAPDHLATPWNVDTTINPPRQWTVGTLHRPSDNARMRPLPASEWGAGCGPYPLRTCRIASDCAPGLACLRSVGTGNQGVCGALSEKRFECTAHAQCADDRMCAGDGVCVDGVWHVRNDMPEAVAFRTYAQECSTGNALDTWGTSVAEGVPDILNASGLCSYRSWFENRRMAQRNSCMHTSTCDGFSGLSQWNFTSPRRKKTAGESAFDSQVLKVKAHVCDRDYQYMEGFTSCTPNQNHVRIYRADGSTDGTDAGASDTRMQTYRGEDEKNLPLLHHMDNAEGPTFGFTGIPMTHAQLRLGTANPSIRSCSSLRACGFQPSFRVNGRIVAQRLVIDAGRTRGYGMQDLLICGVFGYLSTGENGLCRIDFAVAPLAGLLLHLKPDLLQQTEYGSVSELREAFPPDSSTAVADMLSKLPDLVLTHWVGGRPTSLQEYAERSATFIDLYAMLGSLQKPTYTEAQAGTPMQIYRLTQYGAYEVPFAWWYKCNWIGGFSMASNRPISSAQCSWREGPSSHQQGLEVGAYDKSIAGLMGLPPLPVPVFKNTTLLSLLVKLPGVVTRDIIANAKNDYEKIRADWIDRIASLFAGVKRMCYGRKEYIPEFQQASERYQTQMVAQTYNQGVFDLIRPYLGPDNKTEVCRGTGCLQSTTPSMPTGNNADLSERLASALRELRTNAKTIPLTTRLPDADRLILKGLLVPDNLPQDFWYGPGAGGGLAFTFRNESDGCSDIVTAISDDIPLTCLCTRWDVCSASIRTQLLSKAKIRVTPTDSELPYIELVHGASSSSSSNSRIDMCDIIPEESDQGVCALNDRSATLRGIDQTTIKSMRLPAGTSVEFYDQIRWDCVRLTCDARSPEFHNKMVPPTFTTWSSRTTERVVIEEFDYTQPIPSVSPGRTWETQEMENNERACETNPSRFKVLNNLYRPEGYQALFTDTSCQELCKIQERSILSFPPTIWKFRIIRASHYVNNTLKAQVEMMPCLASEGATVSDARAIVDQIYRIRSYRAEVRNNLDIRLCSSTVDSRGVPTEDMFLFAQARITPGMDNKGIETLKTSLVDMINVVRNVNRNFVDDTCATIDKSCAGTMQNVQGSMKISNDVAKDRQNAVCGKLKTDSIFGCNLWPGEATARSRDASAYSCTPENEFNMFSAQKLCMTDSPNDPCISNPFYLRQREIKGSRTIVYQYITTLPTCVAGPVMQCTLVDEVDTLLSSSNINAGCPGTNSSSARYKALNALIKLRKLNTEIRWFQTLSGDSDKGAYAAGLSFDHMYLSLNEGVQCSSSAAYACQHERQIPIQLRRRLWRCVDCPLVAPWQCIGQHNCVMQSPRLPFDRLSVVDGWDKLEAEAKAFLVETDSDVSTAIPAIQWLVESISSLAIPDVRLGYEVTPFMTSYEKVSQFTFNPIPILAYEQAMQKNAKTCDTTGKIPDFTNCSYDGHRRELVDFVARRYKVRDGIVIQPGDTLQWRLSRAQLTSQAIPHWNAMNNKQGMFVSELLSDHHCRNGSMMDNACYVSSDSNGSMVIEVLNPSLLGAFEPMIGCDTEMVNGQRVVSALCDDCARVPVNEYLMMEEDVEMTCPQSYQTVQGVTVDERAESNLCSKTMAYDSKCTNQQRMIGTAAFDGDAALDVYRRRKLPEGRFLRTGLLENKLFRGDPLKESELGNLVLSPDDIGGHSIRMVLSATRGGGYALAVTGIPLPSYDSGLSYEAYGQSAASAEQEWLSAMDPEMEADAMRTLYPPPACRAWDCPLRRRTFYMGAGDGAFRPLVPDPQRTQVLYGRRAHPTQRVSPLPLTLTASTATRVLGPYVTSNGFCACAAGFANQCVRDCKTDEGALRGEWTDSSVMWEGVNQCTEQLDWPYAGGALRDDTTFQPRWSTLVECGVLDRLPVFRYRYKNMRRTARVVQTGSAPKTTLDKGGVCHMGWPVVTAGPLHGCYLIPANRKAAGNGGQETDEEDSFMCPTFLQPKRVTRLRAKTIPELLGSPTRPRLSDCSPPPTYRINDTTTVPPEVSYGQLRRLEASRLLANDLRRRLCGNATVCRPAATWTLGSFWSGVLARNAFGDVPEGNGENASAWTDPWVACVQQANGTQTCEGTIPRKDWATGDRQDLCLGAITRSPLAADLAQDINVCDLDEGMDRFCRTIQDARYQIFEANCLYSGQCRQRLFFYQPSTYAVDNGEFVRSTVQRFYNSTVEGACMPDQDTAQAIRDNAPNLEKCAAMKLNIMADMIQIIRIIIGALVELVYYMGQLMLTIFKLLGASKGAQENAVIAEINALLKLMQNKFILLFEQIGNLVYKIIFEGPMGSWLMGMITAICHFLEWLFSKVVYVVLCWVQMSVVFVLKAIVTPLIDVLNGISFGRLGYLYGDVANAVTSVETNIPCTQRTLWSCNLKLNDADKRVSILPLPTRCWAGVEPGVSSLACTAADTCMTSDFGNVICGACPSPSTSSMIRFGCDTLTKLCTCNVFPSDVTACTSHEECTMEGGGVGCRYVDSYLQPSYGSVPCSQCQNPMCLITDGSGMGKCSCLLRPVPNQACSEPGQAVSPNAAQLCLAAISGGGGLGASNAYTQNYRVLVNVPCMLLNQAQSYCMQVYTSATTAVPLVVGLALLQTGGGRNRRRLLWSEMVSDGAVHLEPDATAVWKGKGEPCRSLVLANVSLLGILEKHTRAECWRWFDVGMHLVTEANMTGVSPFLLVSWHDMVSTMLDHGALVEILAKLPRIIHRLLLHSDVMQPAYIVLTYWTALLPKEVWTNQTGLDDAKRYLFNLTAADPMFVESQAQEIIPKMMTAEWRTMKIEDEEERNQGRNATTGDDGVDASATATPAAARTPMRRLLTHEEALGLPSHHRRLATTVINTDTSAQTVYEWSQGPYSWPPNYVYWQGEKSCAVVSTALSVVRNGLDSTIRFYQSPVPPVSPTEWPSLPLRKGITISVPSLSRLQYLSSLTIKEISDIAEETLSNLTDQVLDKEAIGRAVADAPYMQMIRSLIQCNFTRIQTCEGRRSIFWSAVQSLLILLAVGVIGRVLEIPYIDALLVVAFVPFFMYMTYGYSLTCAPLIPTCLLHDLLEGVSYLFPAELNWPDELLEYPGCRLPVCMRSCVSDRTIGFGAWQDHLAWVICEIDVAWSMRLALDFPHDDPFRLAVLRKCTVQTDSMRAAQRICFGVTIVRTVPFILLIMLALWLIPTAGAIGLALGQFIINVMFTFVLYVHSDER